MLKSTNDGTFLTKVLNQQNSTIQGTITLLSSNKQRSFRSALELLKLIDSAMQDETDDKAATPDKPKDSETII